MSEIRRRKTITTGTGGKSGGCGTSSPSNSGEDLGSTSTSSPDSKNPGSVEITAAATAEFADLSGENEKLKRDNESLSTELAETKRQCEELVLFLTEYVKVAPEQINRIMKEGSCGSGYGGLVGEIEGSVDEDDEKDEEEDPNEESLKLFGVWLKGKKKKRGREEKIGYGGPRQKEMKKVDFEAPWMTSKVCN